MTDSSSSGAESDADALLRVHPSDDSGPTPAPLHGFNCAFARGHCGHDELFRPHYTRTNLRKGDKILRCFPHCCPDHVTRSFCGASLHLDVQWTRLTAAVAEPDVLVFARFRVQGATGYAPGDHVTLAEIRQSLQTESHPHGEWIAADGLSSSHASDGCAWRFELNHDARWFYHWESGVAKRHRLKHHVLDVYVLSPSFSPVAVEASGSDRRPLQVVAFTSSPPFRLISFRRATPKAVQALSVPRDHAKAKAPKRVRTAEPEEEEKVTNAVPRPLPSLYAPPVRSALLPPPRRHLSIADLTASIDRHAAITTTSMPVPPSPAAVATLRLRRLFRSLGGVAAIDTTPFMGTFQRVYADAIARARGVQLAPPYQTEDHVQRLLADAGVVRPHPSLSPDVTAILSELLLWLSFDVELHRAIAAAVARDASAVISQPQLHAAYASFVTWLERHVETFLRDRGWRLDDLLSPEEEAPADALAAGVRVGVAQWSEALVTQSQAHRRHRPLRPPQPLSHGRTPSVWTMNGAWSCDMLHGGLAIQSGSTIECLSLLSLFALLRELGAITIRLDADAQITTMDVVSLLNATDTGAGARLTLDQSGHWCRAFPSGLSTSALSIGGLQWGDHSGEAAVSSETVHCNLYVWAQSPGAPSLGHCVQLQLWTPTPDELHIRVCVSRALLDVQRFGSLDTVAQQLPFCSFQQKLTFVHAWTSTVEAELRYARLK